MSTITVSTSLRTINCPNCGGIYAITEEFKEESRRKGGFRQCWTCPYCKVQRGYGESEADKLRKEIQVQRDEANLQRRLKIEAQIERDHHWTELKKTKKRAKNGVCACCHRTFANVARHMKTKHPDFANAKK